MKKEEIEKRKKMICDLLNDEMYVPMKEKEMAIFLQVSKKDREEFKMVLDTLLAESKIEITLTETEILEADGSFLTTVNHV